MNRRQIRENIFKLVFTGDFYPGGEIPEQVELFFEEMPEISDADRKAITDKFNQIKDKIPEIDEKLSGITESWKVERIGKAELAILRLAVYEMLFDEDVPVKVAINEAVELAKLYGEEAAARFVNGVLAKLVQKHD